MDSDLVATAAATLVEKLTDETWQAVVDAVGRLWRRVHPERGESAEADAEETRAAALQARESGDDAAVTELVGEWRSRLRRLVAADPGVEEELRRLLDEWSPDAGSAGVTGIGRIDMRVTASGHSRVTMAGRDAHVSGS